MCVIGSQIIGLDEVGKRAVGSSYIQNKHFVVERGKGRFPQVEPAAMDETQKSLLASGPSG
jgi:hypothetical protein